MSSTSWAGSGSAGSGPATCSSPDRASIRRRDWERRGNSTRHDTTRGHQGRAPRHDGARGKPILAHVVEERGATRQGGGGALCNQCLRRSRSNELFSRLSLCPDPSTRRADGRFPTMRPAEAETCTFPSGFRLILGETGAVSNQPPTAGRPWWRDACGTSAPRRVLHQRSIVSTGRRMWSRVDRLGTPQQVDLHTSEEKLRNICASFGRCFSRNRRAGPLPPQKTIRPLCL